MKKKTKKKTSSENVIYGVLKDRKKDLKGNIKRSKPLPGVSERSRTATFLANLEKGIGSQQTMEGTSSLGQGLEKKKT